MPVRGFLYPLIRNQRDHDGMVHRQKDNHYYMPKQGKRIHESYDIFQCLMPAYDQEQIIMKVRTGNFHNHGGIV